MKKRERIELNITPMIDIIFILFTFFLVATSFKKNEAELNLRLPETDNFSEHNIRNNIIKIGITKEKIGIDEKIIDFKDFEMNIKDKDKMKIVEIRADKKVEYERLSKILDILQKHKFQKISFVTKKY